MASEPTKQTTPHTHQIAATASASTGTLTVEMKPPEKTPYVVLERIAETEPAQWQELSRVHASHAREAIRQAMPPDANGTFIAIPERSWKPTVVTTETVKQTKFA